MTPAQKFRNMIVMISIVPSSEIDLRYRADITAGSLKVTESRRIADLLLEGADDAAGSAL